MSCVHHHPRLLIYIHIHRTSQVDAVASKTAIFVPGVYDAMAYETYKVRHQPQGQTPLLPSFIPLYQNQCSSHRHRHYPTFPQTKQAEHETIVAEHATKKHAAGESEAAGAAAAATAPTN